MLEGATTLCNMGSKGKNLSTKVEMKSEGATLGFQDTESGMWIGSDNEH